MEEGNGSLKTVWTEKDEITLLKGLKTTDDKSDMARLYELVKPSLDIANLSERKVTKKVSSLKRKFIRSLGKQMPTSSHDALVHKLGKKIWGRGVSSIGPYMTKQEYLARYPHMIKSIDTICSHMSEGGKNVIHEAMVFVSPKELDEMENEWVKYYKEMEEEAEEETKKLMKLREMLKSGEKAYNDSVGQ